MAVMSVNQLGRWSALGVFLVGVAYVVTLSVGMAIHGPREPIVDPVLAIMELLTLAFAPLLVVMMAAVHSYARPEHRIYGVVAATVLLQVLPHLFILFAGDLPRGIAPLKQVQRGFVPQSAMRSTHRANQQNYTDNHDAPEGDHNQGPEPHTQPPHPTMTAHHARAERSLPCLA